MSLFSHEHEDPEPQYLVNMDEYMARHRAKAKPRPTDAEIAALLRELADSRHDQAKMLMDDRSIMEDALNARARIMAERLEGKA